MMKRWYQSKTLWANVVVVLGVVLQLVTNTSIIDTDIQVATVAVINVALRLITSKGLN